MAEPTSEELGVIAGYLDANDVEGLRAYLKIHPELAEGNTPLAVLLRRFLVESAAPKDFFSYQPDNGADSGVGGGASAY